MGLERGAEDAAARRRFPFLEGRRNEKTEKLTDYYFWLLDSFTTRLNFICERAADDIGCVTAGGEEYCGRRSMYGDTCKVDEKHLKICQMAKTFLIFIIHRTGTRRSSPSGWTTTRSPGSGRCGGTTSAVILTTRPTPGACSVMGSTTAATSTSVRTANPLLPRHWSTNR